MKNMNYEELEREINKDVKEALSETRYIHSLGVMKKAEELAKKYSVDEKKARLVGLAHDIAKEMPKEEKLKYVMEHNIAIDEVEKVNVGLLHAKIGADICKRKYQFSEDMQNAIKYHTTGNPNMDDLAKVILVADKTEENRKYEDLEYTKTLADMSLNEATIYIINVAIKNNIEKGTLIHPDGIATRNKLLSC